MKSELKEAAVASPLGEAVANRPRRPLVRGARVEKERAAHALFTMEQGNGPRAAAEFDLRREVAAGNGKARVREGAEIGNVSHGLSLLSNGRLFLGTMILYQKMPDIARVSGRFNKVN